MKKVVVVTDFFHPHWTGISKSIFYLTQALQKEFNMTVLTVRHEKHLPSQEISYGIKIIRHPFLFKLSRVKYSGSLVLGFLGLVKGTDVVFVNSPCSNIFFISLISKIFKKRLVIYHQGDLNLPQNFFNKIIERIFFIFTFLSFKLADQVATYTQDYIQHSRLLPKFKHKASALMIPLPYFAKDFKDQEKQKKISFKLMRALKMIKQNNKVLIGFAGRFTQEKGFDVLLRAISKLTQQRNDVHFVFAGETHISYENTFTKNKKLIDKVGKKLTFLGLLNDNELKYFYHALDLFILPSRSECFGLVQAEAMSAAKPVIVSDIPGAREVVKKTGFGFLFKKNNANDLVKKINIFLNNPSDLQKSHQKVLSYFDYESARKKTIEFIRG